MENTIHGVPDRQLYLEWLSVENVLAAGDTHDLEHILSGNVDGAGYGARKTLPIIEAPEHHRYGRTFARFEGDLGEVSAGRAGRGRGNDQASNDQNNETDNGHPS
ncbi:MAG: hypothetical protein HZY76_02625 [Anaerolineae bacterium]|nr:MAG: hypothetical protein HZY76_02625 [Anaerolineae bacterium]